MTLYPIFLNSLPITPVPANKSANTLFSLSIFEISKIVSFIKDFKESFEPI